MLTDDDNVSLSHEHLNTNIEIPGVVFRIDARSPEVGINYDGTNNPGIFNEGFTARGTDYSLTNHVLGGNNSSASNLGSGYIATTSSPTSLNNILSSITGNMLLHELSRRNLSFQNSGRIEIHAYVYNISPTNSNFFSVVDNLPEGDRFDNYHGQGEWLAVDQINREQIQSAVIYEDVFINGEREGKIKPISTQINNHYSQNAQGYFPDSFNTVNVGITKLNQQQSKLNQLTIPTNSRSNSLENKKDAAERAGVTLNQSPSKETALDGQSSNKRFKI